MGRLEGRTTGWIGIWIEWNGIQIRCLHKISKTGEFAFLIGSPSFVASLGLGPCCCSCWPSPFRDWGECQRGVIVKLLNRPYHPNQILGHETYFCRFAHPLKSRGPRTIRSWSVDIGFTHPPYLVVHRFRYLFIEGYYGWICADPFGDSSVFLLFHQICLCLISGTEPAEDVEVESPGHVPRISVGKQQMGSDICEQSGS